MNSSALPLITSASITIVSILVGAFAVRQLEQEHVGHSLSLGTFSSAPTRYHLVEQAEPQRCFGSLSVSIVPASTQTTITLQGWALVGLTNHVDPVNLEATMVFNALGQLSASVFRTTYAQESIRFGTLGVNPISLQLYRGEGGSSPLLQHSMPGPVELSLHDGRYELHLPSLPALPRIHSSVDSRALPALSVTPANAGASCDINNARHIDLTPFIRLADSLQQAIPGMLLGL
jgi:hypothetical protein